MGEDHKKKRRSEDESTIVFTNVHEALASPEDEVSDRPAALLGVGGELNGKIFNLQEGENIVGREADSTLPLEFRGVSRHHFCINITGKSATIKDLGSKNGTFLNNTKIESETNLDKQDIIKLGPLALKYIPKGDPERLAYDKLNKEATTDSLTSCYNRSFFTNASDLEVKKAKITGAPLSLIIFDYDHFKNVNDTYGHPAGDLVLTEGASLIRNGGLRDQDFFARVGGEEFCILLPKTTIKQAFIIAERVRKLIEDHDFVYSGKHIDATVSLGIADYRQGVETYQDLYNRADKALYASKEKGRNQVNFYKD